MRVILSALIFLLGAGIGSFINMLVFRLRPEAAAESIGGRSYCDSCQKSLRWYELIPVVSFVFQKGKCRRCGVLLPIQYPIVEGVTGLVFCLLMWRFWQLFPAPYGTSLWLWGLGLIGLWWAIAAVLMVIAAYDVSYYLIPDVFLYALIVLGLALNGYYLLLARFTAIFPQNGIVFSGAFGYFMGRHEFSLIFGLWGAVFCLGIIGLAYVLSRGRAMGFGDVLLAVGLGLILGWPDALVAMFLGFISGTLVSLFLLITKKKTVKDIIPFGPFLVLGTFLAVLFSDTIVQWYLSFFNSIFQV